MALLAPPTATVPPASLGGLDQVRWLAEGLAEQGHQVTLIGADLGGLASGGYVVVDTDPTGGERASAELIERLHAEQAGKATSRWPAHGRHRLGRPGRWGGWRSPATSNATRRPVGGCR